MIIQYSDTKVSDFWLVHNNKIKKTMLFYLFTNAIFVHFPVHAQIGVNCEPNCYANCVANEPTVFADGVKGPI